VLFLKFLLLFRCVFEVIFKIEGPDKTTRGGEEVNENQLKFFYRT
jgi:hypothetical protein